MDEIEGVEDDNLITQDDVEQKVVEVLEEVIKDTVWEDKMVPVWINTICEKLIQNLVQMQKPYKFVVTAVI